MNSVRARTLLAISIGASFSGAGCNSLPDGNLAARYCPALVSYTPEQQRRAAAEIRNNPAAELARFATDYGKLRRACREALK